MLRLRFSMLFVLILLLAIQFQGQSISGVQIFPENNVWNTPVDALPAESALDIINDHAGHNVHPDFGTVYQRQFNGIPVNTVAGNTATWMPVSVGIYSGESDVLPGGTQSFGYLPMPDLMAIECDPVSAPNWSPDCDNHLLIIDSDQHLLHELYGAVRQHDGSISAKQYSRWNLTSNALRPDSWTSADAAGLPITPGLIQYEQVAACLAIDPEGSTCTLGHALRFTLDLTHGPHIWPARHDADSGGTNNPPFGLRVRLKAGFDTTSYSPTNRVILNTLKKYGALLADNGGDWFFQGSPDSRWNDDDLHLLAQVIPATDMEVVNTQHWLVDSNSGEANPSGLIPTLSLNANPMTVSAGQSTSLTWSSENTVGCVASDGWSGNKPLSGSETRIVAITTTFTLACSTSTGLIASKSVTVTATGGGGAFSLTSTGAGFDQKISVESAGVFRLVFEAEDNWGLSHWYDLLHDPNAQNNLVGPAYGVDVDITTAEPALFQMVFYGTTPDDPKLYTRASRYYWPSSSRSFEVLEAQENLIKVRATSHPVAGSIGALTNVTGIVTYTIAPNGKILIHSEMKATNPQFVSTWLNSIMGLQNPGGTGSAPPDSAGWIRASEEQNPYEYTENSSRYVFAYWSPMTPAPYTDFAKASVLLVPAAGNPYQGKQKIHSWSNFMRWGYGALDINLLGGQSIIQDYMIQLGTQNSTVLPDIRTTNVAGALADAYLNRTPRPYRPPTVSLSADPTSVESGHATTLTWSSNATSCNASGAWSGSKTTEGSEVVVVAQTSIYTLTCIGNGGATSRFVTVTATSPGDLESPTVSISSIKNGNNLTALYVQSLLRPISSNPSGILKR